MTDIQKMIEEEAIRYCKNSLQVVTLHDKMEIFEAGANFALSQLQHANRWRKVSEELPEYYRQILVKSKDSKSVMCAWLACMDSDEFMFTICGTDILIPLDDVDFWKPIE